MTKFRGALIIILLAAVSGCDNSPTHVRFDKESAYERVLVIDKGDRRYLRFGDADAANQSTLSLSDHRAVPAEYLRIAALGMVLTPNPDRALMIGLGGGTFTRLLRRHFPSLYIDAVEIDPVVVEAARRFFGVQEDERFTIHISDGAKFIRETEAIYDLIFIDAYSGEGMPQALSGSSFFDAVKAKTSAEGVVVLNLFKLKEKEASLIRTFSSRFPQIACIRSSDDLNLVLFGKQNAMPTQDDVVGMARGFAAASNVSFNIERIAERFDTQCSPVDITQ